MISAGACAAAGRAAPLVSIVVPTLNEAATIGALLDDLARLDAPREVIVADGGSDDGTAAIARARGAVVITGPAGRGRQLRAGARAASAPMLVFLHADVRLPASALRALERLAHDGARGAWAFQLRIDGARWSYRLVEKGANLRSRLFALPYGDQGLVLDRETYDRSGGFADVPLMEDVILARALRRIRRIRLLGEPVVVSARRWERDGVWRRSLRNLSLLVRFLLGASPEQLARRY